jgi:hypothetical protein
MTDRPVVDDRDPREVIAQLVERVLGLAETWTAWNGEPCPVDDRVYTPHKAIRRVADHMVDHLAELQARLSGRPSVPDAWRGSLVTTRADMATFEEADLNEARNRLTRLAELWRIALDAVPAEELDRAPGDAYTPRELAFHTAESTYYADAVGTWPR